MYDVQIRIADGAPPPPSRDEEPMVRCLKRGASSLSTAELLSIIIGRGSKDKTSLQLAIALLEKFGSLRNLGTATPLQMAKVAGISPAIAARVYAALELARRCSEEEVRERQTLAGAEEAYKFLKSRLADLPHEVFAVIFLNQKHGVLAYRELFRGSVHGSAVHPREVVKEALKENAAALILAHNHPSGHVSPSPDDLRLTEELKGILSRIDVRVIDHLILGGNDYFSFAREGLLS